MTSGGSNSASQVCCLMKGVLARLWEMLRMWVRRVPASNTKVQLLKTGTVRGRPLQQHSNIQYTHSPGQHRLPFLRLLWCFHTLVPRESKGFLAAGLDPVLFLETNFSRITAMLVEGGGGPISLDYWSQSGSPCSRASGSGEASG